MAWMPRHYCFSALRALAVALLFVHVLLTWHLVGGQYQTITNDQPLLEGEHAAHLYHGHQVAQALRERGLDAIVYDPSYQAGYPMSPWSTTKSRLAAIACWLAPDHPEASYKIAVLACWLILPGAMWLMCRICNSGSGAILGALLLFLSSAWSPWGISLLRSGEMDVLLGTLSFGLALGAMVRCYARPRWWTVPFGLAANAACLYFWPSMLLLLMICFVLFAGLLAGRLPWSRFLGLFISFLGGVALNGLWLLEAWQTWWMLGEGEARVVAQMTQSLSIKANLQLLFWPGMLLVVGFLATTSLRSGIGGRSALVWSCGIVLSSLTALIPADIDTLHLGRAQGWWWCAVWLAALPIGKLLALVFEWISKLIGGIGRTTIVTGLIVSVAALVWHDQVNRLIRLMIPATPLIAETPPELAAVGDILRQQTTAAGRLLWEEMPETASWSPLLAQRVNRPLVGGLGRAEPVSMETLQVRLVQGTMLGRSIESWSEGDLLSLADTYNLGWVAAYHPTSQQRLGRWALAEPVAQLPGGGVLFRINRTLNFTRQGQAHVQTADAHRITLTNLIPEDGQIILCFHAHAKMHVTNARVQLDTWQHPYDGVPMIRLRLTEPMARLTIEW